MTLNGLMAAALRYLTKFGSFGANYVSNWRRWQQCNALQLEATRCRASNSRLFWPELYCTCT